MCFVINQINRCSKSLCQSLQKNKLTEHLNRVYDGVASGSITWPEFLWLCEDSVEKAVIKARQDAASKESAGVVENIFFQPILTLAKKKSNGGLMKSRLLSILKELKVAFPRRTKYMLVKRREVRMMTLRSCAC